MAAEAAIFLMVLSEVMSFPSYVLAGLSGRDKRIERSPQMDSQRRHSGRGPSVRPRPTLQGRGRASQRLRRPSDFECSEIDGE
jgi:hypothetical protein